MSILPDRVEQERLKTLFEGAVKHAREANRQAVQASVDIGKEKAQYFEKIALACAGTIALVVSFVGSHVGRLQPAWLLRSALVALLLGMMAAMYRNWRFPFYLLAHFAGADQTAKRERERYRRDYIVAVPSVALEDGNPVDVAAYLRQFAEDEQILDKRIAECQKQEDSAFKVVQRVDYAALVLTVTGMVFLIALAWRNF
jgi:hypothetical protein